mmetsp:Transcript_9830/g.11044  ORF Transcript_9830/g.11044 Transcript_9830/m.11044 type:complete len:112 (+) Transcript_9830:649-984(+)
MLVGEFPNLEDLKSCAVTNDSDKDDFDMIDDEKLESVSKKRWELLSEKARNLILAMLSVEPKDRPTISEVLENDWLQEPFSEGTPFMVYSEMEARKEYIVSYYQKSKTSAS